MRILIVSDIHANLAAFEQVLVDAASAYEAVWCLGDVIGYGPDPNECVALLQTLEPLALSGNHDWAVLGKIEREVFNRDAQKAIAWAQDEISAATRAYLQPLPAKLVSAPFTLAHGSPRQPVWEYIFDSHTAGAVFSHFETPYCLVGHTHIAGYFEEVTSGRARHMRPIVGEPMRLGRRRLILNPGSVGQPRDGDPRAAYALLDSEALTWTFRRVAYPVAQTQERMRQAGLPRRLINRLAQGA